MLTMKTNMKCWQLCNQSITWCQCKSMPCWSVPYGLDLFLVPWAITREKTQYIHFTLPHHCNELTVPLNFGIQRKSQGVKRSFYKPPTYIILFIHFIFLNCIILKKENPDKNTVCCDQNIMASSFLSPSPAFPFSSASWEVCLGSDSSPTGMLTLAQGPFLLECITASRTVRV